MSSRVTKLISMSTWVNSGWRSARRSSSRKQRTILCQRSARDHGVARRAGATAAGRKSCRGGSGWGRGDRGPLRRRARQEGRLELQEALLVEVAGSPKPPGAAGPGSGSRRGAGRGGGTSGAAPRKRADLVLNLSGGNRRAEHLQFVGDHFHPARGHVRVDVFRRPGGHPAPDADERTPTAGRRPARRAPRRGPGRTSLPGRGPYRSAQLQEHEAAEVALGVHPARQRHLLPRGVRGPVRRACVRKLIASPPSQRRGRRTASSSGSGTRICSPVIT